MTTPTKDHDVSSQGDGVSKRRGPGKVVVFAGLALVAVAGIVGVNFLGRGATEATAAVSNMAEGPSVMQLHPLEVVTVTPRTMEDVVKVTGTVHPAQQVNVSSQVSGLAESVLVRPGDAVTEGDILLEVGTSDLRLMLEQQESTLENSMVQLRAAQATLERTQAMTSSGLTAVKALEAAQADVDAKAASVVSLETQLAQARTNLSRATIRAPFSGTIAARSIEPGQSVSAGTSLLTLVDLSSVQVDVVAPLSGSTKIRPGQTVRLNVQGIGDGPLEAVVDRINPVAEEGTRSVTVFLTLDNPDGLLRGGMFATGEIVVRQVENALTVPVNAVRTEGEDSYVLAIADGVLEQRDVAIKTGWPTSGLVIAEAGLNAGDLIVGAQLDQLSAGMAVAVAVEGK